MERGPVASRRLHLASHVGQVLAATLRTRIGPEHFGLDRRLHHPELGLVEGVDVELLARNRLDGGRLRQPDSGAVLCANSFLNWQRCPEKLVLTGVGGFRELHFATRCPTGIRGTSPLLELIARHDRGLVAVTGRCVEYLRHHSRSLAAGYTRVAPPPGLEPWLDLVRLVLQDPGRFRHVDLPTLIKQALGLGRTFPQRSLVLLYLYLEPADAAALPPFDAHRCELDEIRRHVDGSRVALRAQTFQELWSEWEGLGEPHWLRGIITRLRMRYDVAIGNVHGLWSPYGPPGDGAEVMETP